MEGRTRRRAHRRRAHEIALALGTLAYAAAAVPFWHHANGLETGAYLFVYAWVADTFTRRALTTWHDAVALGGLLGLLILTRVDAVFFVAAFCVYLMTPLGDARSQEPGGTWASPRVMRGLLTGAVACVVASPWFLYGLVALGSAMPTSGTAQQLWRLSASRFEIAATAFLQALVPFVYESRFRHVLLTLARLAIAAFAARSLLRDPARATESESARRGFAFMAALFGAFVALAVWYALSSWATHFYPRYLAPLALVGAIAGGVLATRASVARPRLAAIACVLAALPALGVTAIVHQRHGYTGNNAYRDQLELVRDHVPNGAIVGATQSGTLGFFRGNVVNLDGKVSREALIHRGHSDGYLRRLGVEWLCDFPTLIRENLGADPESLGWERVASLRLHTLYHRRGR